MKYTIYNKGYSDILGGGKVICENIAGNSEEEALQNWIETCDYDKNRKRYGTDSYDLVRVGNKVYSCSPSVPNDFIKTLNDNDDIDDDDLCKNDDRFYDVFYAIVSESEEI